MGLFSSKKKYKAYAASSPLFEASPDSLKSNILQSGITGASKASAVLQTIHTDQFARAKSMFRYASRYEDPSREGGYIRGLPTSNMTLLEVEPKAIEEALGRAVGVWGTITETIKGKWDESFFLAYTLQKMYPNFDWPNGPPLNTHWDATRTNVEIPIVATTGGYELSTNDVEFTRRNILFNFLDARGVIGGDAYVLATADANSEYTVTFPYGVNQTWEAPKITVGDVSNKDWIMVTYEANNVTNYWLYEVGTWLDPIFEAAINKAQKEASFLPVAVLMQDKIWFDAESNSDLTKTTNKLLKSLATTGTEIRQDFQDQEAEDDASGDSNKSSAEKWDFFIHYAVPIHTKVRGSLEYLWYFFDDLRDWSTQTSDHYYNYLASSGSSQPINELRITEAGENGYNVAYRWSYIAKKEFVGDFIIEDKFQADDPSATTRPLKPKEVTAELLQRTEPITPEYQTLVDEFFGVGTAIGPYNNPDSDNDDDNGFHDLYVITKALEDGTGYERLLCLGLSMEYTINTSETIDAKKGYRFRYAQPKLFGLTEETVEFRIPLQWAALQQVPVLHREEVCADGLTATVFLVQVVKTKWYQTGFFKWLLITIAIVLLVISIWFQPMIQAAIATFGAAMGGGGLALYVTYVIMQFAIGFMIALGTSLMSADMQMILSVAIFAAMLYTGQFANIKSSFSALKETPGWLTASSLINAVGPIYNMGFQVVNQYTIGKYEDEFRDLIKTQKERQQELEDAWAAFGPVPGYIDPLDLLQAFQRAGSDETPSSYYGRTLNPNPGIVSYELISNFASIALTLPESLEQSSIIDGMISDFAEQRG